jgi:GNAT superfamily N-acetyltransferase
MSKIIRQVQEHEVYNVVSRIHDQEDIEHGDLVERIEEFEYYNHMENYLIKDIDFESFYIDQDKVNYIKELIEENGINSMPKIIINNANDIIDGVHRLTALKQLGYTKIDLLKGTNEKFEPIFKKELIDEELEIYKISNDFGSISIMENARYSPADNSVFEFLVEEEYRGLGVGTELLKEAMTQYPNLGAQISSIASLKVFLECGFQPKNLQTKEKVDLDMTSYDFKTFNKAPNLLTDKVQLAMYKRTIELFGKKINESKELFAENGQSLYMDDQRELKVELENKKRKRLSP